MSRFTLKRRAISARALLLTSFLLLFSAGCDRKKQHSQAMPTPTQRHRVFVEDWLGALNQELREQAEDVATGSAIQTLVAAERARPWDARKETGLKYSNLLISLYPERQFHKVFAQSSGLTPRGEAVFKVLKDADRHALRPSDYLVERIEELDTRLRELSSGEPHWSEVKLSGEEADQLVDWMREHQLEPADPQTRRDILGALVGAAAPTIVEKEEDDAEQKPGARPEPEVHTPQVLPSPVPRVTEKMGAFLEAFSKNAGLNAELEARVADGVLRYARDMRHFNLAREDWRDFKKAGGSSAIIFARMEETFDKIYNAEPREIAELMAALEPGHPQYKKLLAERERYQEIAESGGWERVAKTALNPGARSANVAKLRQRLAAEGLLPAARIDAPEELDADNQPAEQRDGQRDEQGRDDAPDLVDDELIEAVKAYQETHQFEATGEPDNIFWRSLNVPVQRRIRQIELSMQRWRETQYRDEANYIMVNIPDFHAEVFRDYERQLRFRVVVGNAKRVCDPETKQWTYPHATPIMMASLDHMIFNPYWYVPQSIVKNELEPKMSRDPDYLEKNGYEVVTMNGRETIRQVPGPDNALGLVKFIFPNADNIYMHDTPTKRYFDFKMRAFSHGCVRVHEPEKLATFLLEHNEKDETFDTEELLASDRQKYIELGDKMPVFIEYKTVHVDDEGRANFLADIYRDDQLKLIEDPEEREEYLSCEVPRPSAPDLWGDGAEASPQPSEVESDIGP